MNNLLYLSINNSFTLKQVENGFQLADGTFIPEVIIRTVIILIMFYVASSFFLSLLRMLFDYYLKNKLIDKGLIGGETDKIFKMDRVHESYAIKWFLLYLGGSIGFVLVSRFPFGWISAAILAMSLSFGFLFYFIYLYIINRKK